MGSYYGEVSPTGKLRVKRIRTWSTRIRLLKEAIAKLKGK